MSYPNGQKVWTIVYRWPRYFGLNHDHLSACDRWFQSERWGTSLDNLQLLWQVGGTEHHSERWETTDKAGNDDEIPPKDLVEEGWAWPSSTAFDRLVGESIIQNVEKPLTKPSMMTKFLPKILLKKFEHHSERWETTEKACNNDEIPPKDLVEEVWASFRTLRDHWQSLQCWRNSSQRSCWRRLSWPVTKTAMMTKFLPKILLKKVEHHS